MLDCLLSLSVNQSSSDRRIQVKLLLTKDEPLSNMLSSSLTGFLHLQGNTSLL